MTATRGKVLARRVGDEICIWVSGQVTCQHSPAMRQYVEEGLAEGADKVHVDLRECTYCDSTFLGTLLQLKRQFDARGQDALHLISPSPEFRKLIAQIGAARLFCIVDLERSADAATWEELEDNVDRLGESCFKQNVVDAHQELARAGGPLAERFGPLADAVARELAVQQNQSAEGKPSGPRPA